MYRIFYHCYCVNRNIKRTAICLDEIEMLLVKVKLSIEYFSYAENQKVSNWLQDPNAYYAAIAAI